MQLDLGATAKALAADRAARAAHEAVGAGVLVSLGGDIATCGPAPSGGWAIRVTDDHRDGPDAAGQTITIRLGRPGDLEHRDAALVARRAGRCITSSIPDTGRRSAAPWRTASVAAATCADANIASTAAMVLGDDAPAWLAEQGLPARLVALGRRPSTVQGGWPR